MIFFLPLGRFSGANYFFFSVDDDLEKVGLGITQRAL
jgi:hypothetical protein